MTTATKRVVWDDRRQREFADVLTSIDRGIISPKEAVRVYVSRGMSPSDALEVVGIATGVLTGDVVEE